MKIKVDILGDKEVAGALNKLNLVATQMVKEAVGEAALNVQREARRRCPVDTGRLRSSIRPTFHDNGLAAEVGTDVAYAADVEYGTAPHEIRPKRKKALFWKGADHPVRRVKHPGTRARPFLFPAWEQERPQFLARIKKALGDATKEAGGQ